MRSAEAGLSSTVRSPPYHNEPDLPHASRLDARDSVT